MLYVSPIVEALRGRPRLVFWFATLTQALLWIIVPSIFYLAPPGDVPLVLAIGHEWQLGTAWGPPLAFWLAEVAFRLAGNSVVGVYVLAQLCVIVAFWAIFTLGRAIVGPGQAALAVLMMAGISAFAAPTPDFGPAVLAMPFSALALLLYWRAVGQGRSRYWLALCALLGLLLLTTYYAIILAALMIVFTLATEQGRAALRGIYPYLALPLVPLIAAPHLRWLYRGHADVLTSAVGGASASHPIDWLKPLAYLIGDHAGLAVMVIVGSAFAINRSVAVPELVREPVDRFARLFVYVFALAPAVIAVVAAAFRRQTEPLGGDAALLLLSGLALIVFAGDVIRLYRQPVVGWTWLALLIGPPLLAALSVFLVPWAAAVELRVNEPAAGMGRFFSESFSRRTGRPLAIVVGDRRVGGLVALASPQRPRLLIDASLERSPWLKEADIREHGAIAVWPATDTAGTPPAHIRAAFPDLVPEVPRAFERAVQGRLPLMRIGWGMIRPQAPAPAPQAPTPPQ